MGNIIVSEFVTLDGVAQDPGGVGEIGPGAWAFRFDRGPEGDRLKLDEVQTGAALLLGRVTYEGFAEAWPSRTGEFADLMNSMPKYVVSTTLTPSGTTRRSSQATSPRGSVSSRTSSRETSWSPAAFASSRR